MADNRSSSSGDGRRRRGRRRKRIDHAKFWGPAEAPPPTDVTIRLADPPDGVVRSLGRPPVPGLETMAEHYLTAVYERAVGLAGVVAAAGDLIETEELET